MNTNSITSNRTTGYYLIQIIRILVGVLFIFSGLIKANDPSGLAYKMQEFFELWKMGGLAPYALGLSITMIVFEIIAGVALLIGYGFRLFSILLLILMIFFTFLTGYAIGYEIVNERELKCGCFGDCIPLTAFQSFIKDIILLILVIILVIYRRHVHPLFKRYIGTSIMILVTAVSLFIQWWAIVKLPFIDCLPYKVGNNIWLEMQVPEGAIPDKFQTVLVYEENGQQKEISQDEYVADSTKWGLTIIDTKTKLIEKGNATPAIMDFSVTDFEDNDYTEALLKEPGYNFLFFVRDVNTADLKNIERIKKIAAQALQGERVGFFVLTSSSQAETNAFLKKHKIIADAFKIDAVVSKTAMRSNPGLMLIKGGEVKGKWSYMEYPKSFSLQGESIKLN